MRFKLFAGTNDFALHCLEIVESLLLWEIIDALTTVVRKLSFIDGLISIV